MLAHYPQARLLYLWRGARLLNLIEESRSISLFEHLTCVILKVYDPWLLAEDIFRKNLIFNPVSVVCTTALRITSDISKRFANFQIFSLKSPPFTVLSPAFQGLCQPCFCWYCVISPIHFVVENFPRFLAPKRMIVGQVLISVKHSFSSASKKIHIYHFTNNDTIEATTANKAQVSCERQSMFQRSTKVCDSVTYWQLLAPTTFMILNQKKLQL